MITNRRISFKSITRGLDHNLEVLLSAEHKSEADRHQMRFWVCPLLKCQRNPATKKGREGDAKCVRQTVDNDSRCPVKIAQADRGPHLWQK